MMTYSVVVIYEGFEPEVIESGLSQSDAEQEARFLNFDFAEDGVCFYYVEED